MYPGLLPDLGARGINVINVDTDKEGLSAASLAQVLDSWHQTERTMKLRFPKAVYTVPTGGNPSGTTASTERKRAILQIVRKHSVLILEDDPYYYLSFDGLDMDPTTRPRPPSYFALEKEDNDPWGYGYVLRFESFSKILSAGMRLGFIAGPKPIIEAVSGYMASSSIHASSPMQVIAALLLKHWGISGFQTHVDEVARLYQHRRNVFESKLQSVLGGDASHQGALASWVTPVAGMFFWVKLHLPPETDAPEGDSSQVITKNAVDHNVLAVPGQSFYAGGRITPYVRLSFSVIPEEKMEEGLRRLRMAIEDTWKEHGYSTIPPM